MTTFVRSILGCAAILIADIPMYALLMTPIPTASCVGYTTNSGFSQGGAKNWPGKRPFHRACPARSSRTSASTKRHEEIHDGREHAFLARASGRQQLPAAAAAAALTVDDDPRTPKLRQRVPRKIDMRGAVAVEGALIPAGRAWRVGASKTVSQPPGGGSLQTGRASGGQPRCQDNGTWPGGGRALGENRVSLGPGDHRAGLA